MDIKIITMDYVWRSLGITLTLITAVTAPLPDPPRGFRYCNGDSTKPGLCMEIVSEALDWQAASTFCQTEFLPYSGKLIRPKDQDVQDWVAGILDAMGWQYAWFNGYRKLDNGKRVSWFWQRRGGVPSIAYQGCFRDELSVPDLQTPIETSGNTPMQCLQLCDKAFASVQLDVNGVMRCRCGETFGRYGRVYHANCDLPCTSSIPRTDPINTLCGGPGYQLVYLRRGKKFHAFAATSAREYHHCVVMNHMFNHLWTEQSCHLKTPYICLYRVQSENQCGHTWAHSQCISIHHEEKDFFTATTYCYSHHADLLNLSNMSLQLAVTALLNPDKSYYIGLTDEKWIDTYDKPILSYFNWAPGQPNDEEGNICLKIRREPNYGWYNSDCHTRLPFMCMISVPHSQNSPPPSTSLLTNTSGLPPTTSSASSESTTTSTEHTIGGLSHDLVIGLAAGGGGALLLTTFIILCYCFCKRHYHQKSKKRKPRDRVRSQDLPSIPEEPLAVDKYYSKTNSAYRLNVQHQPARMDRTHGPRPPRSEAYYADVGHNGYEDLDQGSISSHTYDKLNHDYHKYEYVDMPGEAKGTSKGHANKEGGKGLTASRGKGNSDRRDYESSRSERGYASSKSGRSQKSGYGPSH